VRTLRVVDGHASEASLLPLGDVESVSSFGEDAAGELYVVEHARGRVSRIVPVPAGAR